MPDNPPPPRKPARIIAAGQATPPTPIQGRPAAARRNADDGRRTTVPEGNPDGGRPTTAKDDEQPKVSPKRDPVANPQPSVVGRPPSVVAAPLPSVVRRPSSLWALRDKYRWVLGLAALGVALYAQKLASDDRAVTNGVGAPPLLSWALFGLAAVIFAFAIPATAAPSTGQAAPFLANLRLLKKRRLFLALLGGAILCDVIALPLFLALNGAPPDSSEPQGWLINTGSWLLYIAALLLFAAAWVVWERTTVDGGRWTVDGGRWTVDGRPTTEDEAASNQQSAVSPDRSSVVRPPSLEWLAMAAIFVLALLLRLPNLDSAPPGIWFDEAQNGIVARNLLGPNALHPTFLGDFTQMGAFYFYILGIVGKLFGDTLLWPVRLLPALSGALIAPMLYLIGSRLYGWRVGVAAGVLVAVSSWNITFSRFGIASMPTVALDIAAYLCLMQALRTGRLGFYAAGGVLVGLALQMYYVSQLTPVVFGLVFLYRLITERARFWRAVRSGVGLFVAGLILAFLPVATFAVQHPEVYTARTGAVSIFSPEGSDGHPDALGIGLTKHALMFNYAGDGNGRHNIPGEPLLDWWTGALFIAGVGVCLLRIRRWHYFYPFVWLLVSMAGGVLTVIFEAPQAHRTLESSVVVSLIAGIFLGELAGALAGALKTGARVAVTAFSARRNMLAAGASFALLVPVLGLVGATSVDRYFNRQMNAQGVWLEMLGADRAIGQYLARYGDTHKIYLSAIKAGYPTSVFLAPNAQITQWPGTFSYPLSEERDSEVILIPSDSTDVALIKQTYPNAVVEVTYGPDRVLPQLFSITIPASDIAAARGVQARIYPKDAAKQSVDKVLPTLSFDGSGADANAGSVRLATTLKIDRYADYKFNLADANNADIPGSITVDGFDIQPGAPKSLTAGLHSLVMTATVGSAQGVFPNGIRLLWDDNSGQGMHAISALQLFDPQKVQPHGLTALFRNGDTFDGPPANGRIDPSISFYFHLTPLPRPYSAEWVGKVYAPVSGTYLFGTEQISNSQLSIDGKQLIDNREINKLMNAQVDLQQGLHDIRLLYQDHEGFSHMYLYWTPPGMGGSHIIPSAFLWPVMNQYPNQPEYGRWPTLEQADDTEWSLSAEAHPGTVAADDQPQIKPTIESQPTQPPAEQQPTQPQQNPPTVAPVEGQTEAKPIQPLLTLGKEGEQFERPKAAAVDDSGNIYLYAEIDGKIRKFGPDGKMQKAWAVTDKDGRPATEISALVIKDGKLLALDAATSELVSYTLDGGGGERAKICGCFFPRGMAVSNDGNFWITNTGGAQVLKVSPDGKTLAVIEGNGPNLGEFVEPAGVWESPDGALYVADVGNSRIQTFSSADLKPIHAWAMGDSVARDGNRVSGDSKGVLVTEYASRAVVRYDATGKELARWVYKVGAEASFPAGIASAGNGKFVVVYPFDNMAVLFDASK